MSDTPDPRDLDLARRLDAGQAPDGSDTLHAALDAARPLATPVAPEASARLWDAIASETGLAPEGSPAPEVSAPEARPARAADRAPRRGARTRVPRWVGAVAALVLVAAVGSWALLRVSGDIQPVLVAQASGEIVTWTAPDGSRVTLRPRSQLSRVGDGRAYALTGEAFFDVASDPDSPFTVETDAGTVRVLGTRFDVSTWGGETHVYVEEGRVELAHESQSAVLTAGEGAAALAYGVERLAAPEAEAFLDWTRGEAVFSRETVARVAQEMEQHFGVPVRIPEGVGRETISGVVALDSAPEAMDQLGRILGGTFVPEARGYRFVRP